MALDISALRDENQQLAEKLADPNVAKDPQELGKLAKRKNELESILSIADTVEAEEKQVGELESLLKTETDDSLRQMATEELSQRQEVLTAAKNRLEELSVPKHPNDEKSVIMEVRAGAGGDEASLFAQELYSMYQRYAETQGWKVEIFSSSPSTAGGYKEVVFRIAGEGAYGKLKFEGGTHRVQRIPVTESGGRIHTSTVTVAVLPEAEEVEVDISPEELRVDVFRSSGPGGQSVNTTDSAVRITHIPTGITVSCQDEKSQHKNKAKAMTILRSRLQAVREEEAAKERGDQRRQQVGTGDRSEKIRTYNFPQDRVTDHRINYSTHGLDKVLTGELDGIFAALEKAAREAQNS